MAACGSSQRKGLWHHLSCSWSFGSFFCTAIHYDWWCTVPTGSLSGPKDPLSYTTETPLLGSPQPHGTWKTRVSLTKNQCVGSGQVVDKALTCGTHCDRGRFWCAVPPSHMQWMTKCWRSRASRWKEPGPTGSGQHRPLSRNAYPGHERQTPLFFESLNLGFSCNSSLASAHTLTSLLPSIQLF